jgi:hypothetical protein
MKNLVKSMFGILATFLTNCQMLKWVSEGGGGRV